MVEIRSNTNTYVFYGTNKLRYSTKFIAGTVQ